MSYEYTSVNRFESPHYYMYTKYNGKPFLREYFESRELVLNTLYGKVKRNGSFLPLVNNLADFSKPLNKDFFDEFCQFLTNRQNLPSCELLAKEGSRYMKKIATSDSFKALELSQAIMYLLIISNVPDRKIYNILSVFNKKFEVFRKIFTQYSQEFRKTDANYKNFDIYINFSFCFLYYYHLTGNLKFISGALKMNDAICSVYDQITKVESIIITMMNIRLERAMIMKLIKSKNIEL